MTIAGISWNHQKNNGTAGYTSSLFGNCYSLGTWNVRSLFQQGKLACVIQEMEKLNLNIIGISETFWPDAGEFQTSMPTSEENDKFE